MQEVLSIIVPIIITIILGYFIKKIGLISREGIDGINKLAINIMLPLLLFKTFSTNSIPSNLIVVPIISFVVCCVMLGLGYFMQSKFNIGDKISLFFASGFEVGMLGYALFSLIHGSEAISSIALLDIGHVLFIYVIYITLVKRQSGHVGGFMDIIKSIFTSSLCLSVFLGIIIGATGLGKIIYSGTFGSILINTLESISQPLGILILLIIGYEIDLSGIDLKYTSKIIGMRLISCLIGFGLMYLGFTIFNIQDKLIRLAGVFILLLPPPYILPIFAKEENRAELSAAISVDTLLTIAFVFVYMLLI